jgi:hypothetical protein
LTEESSARARGWLPGFAAGARVAGYRLGERIGAGGMAVVYRAVIVPVASQDLPGYSSVRVHQYCSSSCPAGVVISPTIGGPDLTNVWLSGG